MACVYWDSYKLGKKKKGERGWREHLAHFMQVLPGKLSGYQLGKHRPPVFSSPQTSDTQADVTAHLPVQSFCTSAPCDLSFLEPPDRLKT